MKISSKVYDVLKYIALIGLPALCFFLSTIGEIWNFGWMPKVVATISAVATLIGALLQISTNKYWKDNSVGGVDQDGI